jgi:hypothetical protein
VRIADLENSFESQALEERISSDLEDAREEVTDDIRVAEGLTTL